MQTYDLLWWPSIRQAVELVEARLPEDVQAALANVIVTTTPRGFKHWGDAGPADIRLRPDLHGSTAALMAVAAHELSHVYLGHPQALRAGLKSVEQVEREADALVRAWGFHEELEHRRLFYGR